MKKEGPIMKEQWMKITTSNRLLLLSASNLSLIFSPYRPCPDFNKVRLETTSTKASLLIGQ